MQNSMEVRGMLQVQIEEDGKIVSDSGWVECRGTDLGFNEFLTTTVDETESDASVCRPDGQGAKDE